MPLLLQRGVQLRKLLHRNVCYLLLVRAASDYFKPRPRPRPRGPGHAELFKLSVTNDSVTARSKSKPWTNLKGEKNSIHKWIHNQSGGWGLKNLRVNVQRCARVFKYFRQFKEKRGPVTFCDFAPRLYNRYNHAHWHAPCPHKWPTPSAPKQWRSDVPTRLIRVKTLSARDCHWRNPRKKKL